MTARQVSQQAFNLTAPFVLIQPVFQTQGAVVAGGMMSALAAGFSTLQNADAPLVQRCSPLRWGVEIDEVAETVAFLASPAASGYHGGLLKNSLLNQAMEGVAAISTA